MERNDKAINQQNKQSKSSNMKNVSLNDFPAPDFINHRIQVWDQVKQERQAEIEQLKKPIQIKLPDGKFKSGVAFELSPLDIARSISKKLAEASVVAKVDGALWDLKRPFEADASLELIKIDSEEGKKIFWNSSAFVLAQALERKYQALMCVNVIEDKGFYCDMASNKPVVPNDFEEIQGLFKAIVAEKQSIERLEVPKEKALEMFKYNKYKVQLINEQVADGAKCVVYRCGQFIDFCNGPHVPNLAVLEAFVVKNNSSSYWQGNKNNDSLQRVYGMSFAEQEQLEKWQKDLEDAAKRDHRNIGQAQELFFGHKWAPGCAFFLPNGAKVYNKLIAFVRKEYRKRGFVEVMSPNMFNNELFNASGHDAKYRENMFCLSIDEQENSLKPMNCPGHCLIFDHQARSYRDLPLRLAEFGVLHRNEAHGALSGLTRVRRFVQDDAHIFCSPDQISQEIQSALAFMSEVYNIFGFEFSLALSSRPENYLGELAVWDKAEAALKDALDKFGKEWKLNPGDGAFYGPKIDIRVKDALKREHQCATIQLDFVLPERFQLNFRKSDDSMESPVMIHRAIFGSIERFIAILIEHCGGKWPFWISPRQAIVVPVSEKSFEYAKQVQQRLWAEGFEVELSDSNDPLKRQIAEAHDAQFNFILVVGEEEAKHGSVNVRARDNAILGSKSIDDLIAEFRRLDAEHK